MRILLAESDYGSRKAFSRLLSQYGECDVVVDGEEAVECFVMALENNEPYDLACLDVLIPVMDGHQVLKKYGKSKVSETYHRRTESKSL